MEGRLFEDLVVSRPAGTQARAGGIPLSLAVHAAALIGLAVLSVAVPEDLPATPGPIIEFPPGPVARVAAPSGPARRPAARAPATTPRVEAAPALIPIEQEMPFEDFLPAGNGPGNDEPCARCRPTSGGGGDDAVLGTGTGTAAAADPGPRRPGGLIQPPLKIRHVAPVYPELARRAGVTGTVILECVIDREGHLRSVAVLRGHPLLDGAAMDAVRQWTYRPTLLNGVPVEIVMTVTVRFTTR